MKFKFEVDEVVKRYSNKKYKVLARAYDEEDDINKYFCVRTAFPAIVMWDEDEIKKYRKKVELKPCPNCGGTDIKFTGTYSYSSEMFDYYDEIVNDRKVICDARKEGCGLSTGFYGNDTEKSIEAWNSLKR